MNKEEECDPVILLKIISSLKNFVKGKKLDYTTLIVNGMEIVEKYKKISGPMKKKYFMIAIRELANGNDDIISLENVIIINKLLQEKLLENMVDMIIDISKGLFDINKSSKLGCRLLC